MKRKQEESTHLDNHYHATRLYNQVPKKKRETGKNITLSLIERKRQLSQ